MFFYARKSTDTFVFAYHSNPHICPEKNSFDETCERTSSITAYKNLPKAIRTADSLYMSAQKPSEKIRSLMLSSELITMPENSKKPYATVKMHIH
ncbi:hypothetical protein EJ377_03265 [Chryseobacterium arthrosphaerae]|uniref:Uncharacterized protein n=1 Tax=Chryseobacterium arthrosphaerae TaxID=651561 RepID=A0A3S0VJ73_9FLAO|nr:hypothetical protein EJ377_03265 [Chryseobacterium arthrosphaerae]